jgi:hypothetical protein
LEPKGVGRIYHQTVIDTSTKVAFAKLYDRKTPITAADLLNDRVLPFFDSQGVKLLRVLTDRGTEYSGNPERHEDELYLAIEDRASKPKARRQLTRTFFGDLRCALDRAVIDKRGSASAIMCREMHGL